MITGCAIPAVKKFQAGTAKAAEKARQEKIQQELNAKARRKALLSAANPVILQNIDNEVIEAENRYKALKARLKADKQAFCKSTRRVRYRIHSG